MILEMKNITKAYDHVLANDDISLFLNEGEVLSIVGENGAGKSTIMKVLYGLEQKDAGEIFIDGEKVDIKNPRDAIKHGIGMVQQHFMLFSPFSVYENVVFGEEPQNGLFFDRKKARQEVLELSERYGLKVQIDKRVEDCPIGIQQRIEILKVLYQNARIIIFDEPSAVLTPQEVEELLVTIKTLSKLGKSIILITHKLNEVMEVSDRIFVMCGGKHIATKNKNETNIEEISYLMIGRSLKERQIPAMEKGKAVLEIKNLCIKDSEKTHVKNISMHIDEGEIVGIAGVSGNGQSKLLEALMGLRAVESGNILLNGKEIANESVLNIRESGLSAVPEDRYLHGCAKQASLSETAIMNHHKKFRFSKNGLLNHREIREFTTGLLEKYDVRYGSLSQLAGQLSGGNIQKLIVARELSQNTKLLIAAEPTRGVDIGAMEDIHQKLIEKRNNRDAILLVSSELSEIMALSDRIYVIYNGELNGEFTREKADFEQIGLLMAGGAK